MPNIPELDKVAGISNGDAGNISLLSSTDDEESFVVLERSTADGVSLICEAKHHSQTQQNGSRFSFPSLMSTSSNYVSTGINTSQNQGQIDPIAIPYDSPNISLSVEEIDKRLQEVLHENINLKENLYQTNLAMKQQLGTVRLLQDRAFETQKQHQAKFEETKALIIKLGSEKNELQEKLSQLNEELNKVKAENKELKETNLTFGADATKLVNENESLQKELASIKQSTEVKNVSLLQVAAKEIEMRELIDQLTRKLEAVERARRQQDFDIDRLQAQLANHTLELTETQRKLAHAEQALQAAQTDQVKNENTLAHENTLHFGEKLTKYEGLLKQIEKSIQEEQSRFNSLDSWLTMTDPAVNSAQFEISELRHLLSEEQSQSVARKDKLYKAVTTIHELLVDFQKLGEELERVKADYAVKESHGLAYDEMQKKGFRERLDSLTAKLVEREEALAISERHLASLQEAVRLQNDEKKETAESSTLKEQVNNLVGKVTAKDEELKMKNNEIESLKVEVQKLKGNCDTITVLEEQAKIYQADFEAERKSREALVAEKERLMEDLRHLQRRNHELIEELNSSRRDNAESASRAMPAEPARPRELEKSPSPQPVRPQDEAVPLPKRFYCPNPDCNMWFTTLDPLQLHVITCLKLDD